MTLTIHPICLRLPAMSDREFDELRESIRERGLVQPIELFEGKVLDGRHRLKACLLENVEPKFVDFTDGDPWLRVWDRNGARREFKNGSKQKYAVWKVLKQGSDDWAALQAKVQARANAKRSEKAKGNKNAVKKKGNSGATNGGTTEKEQPNRSSIAKAAAAGVDRGTVEKVEQIIAADPSMLERLASGEIKGSEAQRQTKRAQLHARAAALPQGQFRVIYADPPWKYNDERKTDDGHDVSRSGASTSASYHYPTMSMSELEALDVATLAAPDCVLWLWATFPLLPEALQLAKAWGFKYKTSFVWDKVRGTFGNYHNACAELLIIATRGSATPDIDKRAAQVQRWPRAEHSRKPDDARELIDSLYTVGARIELFRRGEKPRGWEAWGLEAHGAL